ncbi:MAG TPA: IniB N-terminal domain-containing protein [Sporichthyaceae bacterium]
MATSLLDWIMNLLANDDAREAFQADPKNAMASAGMSSVCASDVRDSRAFLVDHPHVRETNHFRPAAAEAPAHEHVRAIVDHYRANQAHGPVDNHNDNYSGNRDEHDHRAQFQSNHEFRGGDRLDDSFNRQANHDDSYNRQITEVNKHQGVGPTSGEGTTAADQHASTVGNDQYSEGGNHNLRGDNNDASHDQRFDSTVSGDHSAGRDIHEERGGAVFGQGVAGGDIDHTGGLAGLDHTVDVGTINVLSGIASPDVLSGPDTLTELGHNLLREGALQDIHDIPVHDILQHVVS